MTPPKPRNPIAKAVTRMPAKVVPDKRRKLVEEAQDEEPYDETDGMTPAEV